MIGGYENVIFAREENKPVQYLTIWDLILTPIYLLIIIAIARRQREKRYPEGHALRPYFLPGLYMKLGGAIFIGLLYQFYYGGGDTFNYFRYGQVINSAFADSPNTWFNLLIHNADLYTPRYYQYITKIPWYNSPANYTVCAISAFVSLFTFGTYLPAAIIFAFVSFGGMWALFKTFASLNPTIIRPIAISILFIPSTFVWGSGIFKDTICMFGLGWLTYASFRFLIQKDFSLKNVIIAGLCLILIAKVKVYILLGFIPALVMWILSVYTQKIKSSVLKLIVKTGVIIITLSGSSFFLESLGEEYLGRYSLENIEITAESTRRWITYSSGDEGSTYSLGNFPPTITGMLAQFPLAVNVTLFRPYLWEARKVIVFLSALEAAIFLFLTLKLFFVVGLKRIWSTISKNPTVQFCFIFSIIFAFAVGVTSYNFGALSRYKIPCIPFYSLFLILTFYLNQKPEEKLLGKII